MKNNQPKTCQQCALFCQSKITGDCTCIRDVHTKRDGSEKACEKFTTPKKMQRSMKWMMLRFRFSVAASRVWFWCVRAPLGRLRKPIPIAWEDALDSGGDIDPTRKWSLCPRCGEMPYSTEWCLLCGQRFTKEEEIK